MRMMTIDQCKTTDAKASFAAYRSQAEKLNTQFHAFVHFADYDETIEKGSLYGVPYAVKDIFVTKDVPTTACSKMLADFVPYYDAKVVRLLKKAGAMMLGKTVMDEFAFGSTGRTSCMDVAVNPVDKDTITGGSSSGSAVAVKAGQVCFALGSDTSGSVRQPAAFCGVVGVKPSCEAVSNEGLIACVSSMDAVGVLASCVEDSARVLEVLSEGKINGQIADMPKGTKVGVPEEYFAYGNLDSELKGEVEKAIQELEKKGAQIVPVSIPHFAHQLTVYGIIGTSEVSSNFAKMDGMKYGHRGGGDSWEEIFMNSRSQGFGETVKERIIAGTFFMCGDNYENYLVPAQQVRTLIIQDYERALAQVDCLVTPTTPTYAYPTDAPNRGDEDVFTVGASLAGLPAISVPYGKAGVQVMAAREHEEILFAVARQIEQV